MNTGICFYWIIYPNWLLAVDTYSLLNASQQSQAKHKKKSIQAEKHAQKLLQEDSGSVQAVFK